MDQVIISSKETEGIMKIVKSLKESGLLIKGIREAIKNEAKECCLNLQLILKHENIIKTKLNLVVFTQEVIYLK